MKNFAFLSTLLLTLVSNFAVAAETTATINLSINRLEQQKQNCVAYFLLRNKTSHNFSEFQIEFIVFDKKDLISTRFLGDFKKIKKNKTLVKLFGIPKTKCSNIAKVLVNDMHKCKISNQTQADCLKFINPKPILFK